MVNFNIKPRGRVLLGLNRWRKDVIKSSDALAETREINQETYIRGFLKEDGKFVFQSLNKVREQTEK